MKIVIPYPLLFVTAIILDRVAISSAQISSTQSLRALSILLFMTMLAMMILQYFIRDWHYTNFAVLMIWMIFIIYRSLYGFLKIHFPQQANDLGFVLLPELAVVYVVFVSPKVWKSIHNPARITYYCSLIFIVLLSFQLTRVAKDIYHAFMTATHPQLTAVAPLTADIQLHSEKHPDIYIIILDGYAREDVLRKIYGYDNSEFIHDLKERGFFVASDNHSNYTQTAYAMASLWNFDYLQRWDSSSDFAEYLLQPIESNRVFHLLDEIGYTTVSFEGELSYIQIKNSDVYLSNHLPLNKFETLLLMDSPFELLAHRFNLGLATPTYTMHRQQMLYDLDMLKELPTSIAGPKVIYSHILMPHPPFVFDQDGHPLEPQQPYGLSDANRFAGSQEEYWNGYREQVIVVNREIMKVIDAILAKSQGPPIILLMGDHGPASMFNWSIENPGCVWERTSNLYAMLLPGHLNDGTLYSSISPVNTFRVIFNTYFGADLPLLEDRTYLMAWQQPTLQVDVTETRDSLENCTVSND